MEIDKQGDDNEVPMSTERGVEMVDDCASVVEKDCEKSLGIEESALGVGAEELSGMIEKEGKSVGVDSKVDQEVILDLPLIAIDTER